MQNWKRRQREEARSVWFRRCRGTVCPPGIFSSSRFWSCSGEETPSYLLDHLAFGSTGSNELAGLCIKSVCFLSSAGGPSGGDRRFGHIAFLFSLIPRNPGFFEQKSPKSWILPKRAGPRWNSNAGRLGRNTGNAPILASAGGITGRPQPWKLPSLETPIPHGFGGPGPGSPEQILASAGRRSFRLTDRWSASSYQTDRTPGLRSFR